MMGTQIVVLTTVLLAVIITSTGMGFIKIPFADVVKIIAGNVTGLESFLSGMDDLLSVIVIDVRLPRILTAATV